MNKLRLTFLLPLILLLGFMPAHADNEAKSDYYFMEAMRMRALGNEADADVLLNRAYELNPDPSSEIAKAVAFGQVSRSDTDSTAFVDALGRIEKYVSLKPDDVYAAVSLAGYYANSGQPEKALPLIARADSLNPAQPALALRHASLLEKMGRPKDAFEIYKRIEVREGKRVQLTYAITRLMFNVLQDTIGALAEVDALTAALPGDVEALTLAISLNDVAGHPEEARRLAERAISMEPDNEPLREFCIQTMYDSHGLDAALDVYAAAIKAEDLSALDKQQLLIFFTSGMNIKPEDQQDGLDAFAKAAEIFEEELPDDYSAPLIRSGIAMENKDLKRATEEIAIATMREPTFPELWLQRMRLHVAADEPEMAVAVGNEALAVEGLEESVDIRMMLAGAYSLTKQYKEIPVILKPLLDNEEIDPQTRSAILSTIADAEQNYLPAAEAAKTYEQAIELDPENYLAKNNYAYMISEKGGDLELAKQLISQVLKKGSQLPTYLDTAAWVYFKLGQYVPAKEYIDKALKAVRGDTFDPELLLHAGDIYYRCGEQDKAMEFWKRALDAMPDSDDLNRRVELKSIPE